MSSRQQSVSNHQTAEPFNGFWQTLEDVMADKASMLVQFKIVGDRSVQELRENFDSTYELLRKVKGILFKNWWVNKKDNEWGAYYIFNTVQEREEYLASEFWQKTVPSLYGVPKVTCYEPGPIIAMNAYNKPKSWLSD